MKKNLYESVLQAITEIDLCEASYEDMLRIGISAEQGAINLYNRIAKELEKRSESGLFELFRSVAQEEKVHVGEFQEYLKEVDHEEKYSIEMGRDEAEEIMELDLLEDVVIRKKDKKIILEKGDRIKILKEDKYDDFDTVVEFLEKNSKRTFIFSYMDMSKGINLSFQVGRIFTKSTGGGIQISLENSGFIDIENRHVLGIKVFKDQININLSDNSKISLSF